MANLEGKHILLGVSGGIAAYKTPELVRLIAKAGGTAEVMMTRGAANFVTPMALAAVAGHPVHTDQWQPREADGMDHIRVARRADAMLLAPATAHLLARLAAGLADDLLTTTCLAAQCPVAVAPTMNQQMWQNGAVRRNLALLAADGVTVLGPASGPQACGEFGPGRMLEPAALVDGLEALLAPPVLSGRRVVVTAGPTREALDPVRYISNHSSGRQGFAVAAAARAAGAEVCLISGPVALPTPVGVRRVDVTSAAQMLAAVEAEGEADIFIGVAAVADYRPRDSAPQKIKKAADGAPLSLALVENPDILCSVTARTPPPFTVAFAAETHDALEHAREKRRRKRADMIVVNDVANPEIGFDGERNAVTVITERDEHTLGTADKRDIARQLVMHIADAYAGARAASK